MHSIIPKVYRADEDVTLILIFEFFNYSWFARITNNFSVKAKILSIIRAGGPKGLGLTIIFLVISVNR